MTLQQKLKPFGEAFAGAAPHVYHYFRMQKEYPCIVWQENGGEGFWADDAPADQAVSGTLDYFTQAEFDPAVDQIQNIFKELGIHWALNSVQFEENTRLIHWEWTWEV